MAQEPVASDGLPAREAGEWAALKLDFLSWFGPIAIDATALKHRRIYIDLFAGPGINVDKAKPGHEFESGALRVLRMVGQTHPELGFTDFVLVNLDPEDHAALELRIDRLREGGAITVPPDRIVRLHGDANALLPSILGRFPKKDYLLVFADPENPSQWPWVSVAALRAHGHESVDLYSLLPLEMGIRRLLKFNPRDAQRTKYAHILTAFFGCDDWRPIAERRHSEAQSKEMLQALEDLYLRRLRNGLWEHVDRALTIRRAGEAGLYRMVFATDHKAGKKIAGWAKRKATERDQPLLGGGFA